MSSLNVTPIAELEKSAKGEVIPLPPFSEGSEFNARVRRLSIASLVTTGKLPNPLLNKVYKLFGDGSFVERIENGKTDKGDQNALKDFNLFVDTIVREALIEPSVSELQKAGISLTAEQKTAILNYIQGGIEALSGFRNKQGDIKNCDDVKDVPTTPQPNT